MDQIKQRQDFSEWLASDRPEAFRYRDGGTFGTIIRVPKNESFDYLYVQRHGQEWRIDRRDKFEYCGLYCKKDSLVYDARYDVYCLIDGYQQRGTELLRVKLETDVRSALEERLGNDRSRLSVTELPERWESSLNDYRTYRAVEAARVMYLNGDEPEDWRCECHYVPEHWDEETLLAYILNPAFYTSCEAERYWESSQEQLLFAFLTHDMVIAEYLAILGEPRHPIHAVKRIRDAVEKSSAKTVTVTIRKNGEDFTFKTEAYELTRDCTSHYSDWHIVAADRRRFAAKFGRNAHYTPKEIVRIAYARRVIYEREGV
jgi:hypothetical protein